MEYFKKETDFNPLSMAKNTHAHISKFKQLLGVRFVSEHNYMGVMIAGDFEENLGSYGLGLLSVHIYTLGTEIGWITRIYIGTLDDGEWFAESTVHSLDEANVLTFRVYANFIEDYPYILPNANELNKWLRKFGMYGTN